jgi:hypothetical protein
VRDADFPLWFGGRFWPRRIAERKFLFAGMSGGGKTLSIRLLYQTALYGFGLGVPRRALVYDAKGNWPGITRGIFDAWGHPNPPPVRTLNPFDADGYGYDFQADFMASANHFGKAVNFAKTLIPDSAVGGDKTANFFTSAAQIILAWVTLLVHERAKLWTLRDIIVAATDQRIIDALFKTDDRAAAILGKFAETPQTYANVLQTVESFLWQLEPAALACEHHIKHGRRFTFSEWFKSEDILIMSGTDPNPAAVEPMNSLLIEFLRQEFLAQPECEWYLPNVRETWLFLDEFQKMAPSPRMVDFFTLSRSKGGVQVVGVQDIDQLIYNYREELANTILAQCGYIGITKLNSPKTAAYFAKLIGSHEQVMKFTQDGTSDTTGSGPGGGNSSSTTSRSISEQLMTRPGALEQDFTKLKEVDNDLVLDGYYIAGGPYERHPFALEYCDCPLINPAPGFQNYRPLQNPAITRPRAFQPRDFERLSFTPAEIPKDYYRERQRATTNVDQLRDVMKGWAVPSIGLPTLEET